MTRPAACAFLLIAAAAATGGSLRSLLFAQGPLPLVPAAAAPALGSADRPLANPDPAHYLFEDKIKPGMKGYGLTVIHGGKIEKFQIEVIDVVKNLSPGNNAILVRCAGLGLENSGIIAGMSGSPCYIDGKMIGAIAYGWTYSKDPIGGVQPIRQMLNIPVEEKAAAAPPIPASGGARWSEDNPLTRAAQAGRYGPLVKNLAHRIRPASPLANDSWHADKKALGLQPLASPLMVGGGNDSTRALLASTLANSHLIPIASGSAGSTPGASTDDVGGVADLKPGEIQLEPGSAIAIPLLTGDMDLSAIGTVTEVRGNRIYAFGHSMFAEGHSELPIATGYIYTIMPNVQQSFKMGASLQTQGSLIMDEQTAIIGELGRKPPTVPINITVQSADGLVNHKYSYQLAPHPRLTPEILGAAINESLAAQRGLPKYFTLALQGTATFAGADGPAEITLDQTSTNDGFNPLEAVMPIALLNDNPFENLAIKSVDMTMKIASADRSASITNVTLDRLTVAPGDEVNASVEIAPWHADARKIPVTIKIPADAPEGKFELTIGSAQAALMEESSYAPQHFDPTDITTMVTAVNHILSYRADKLYATLVLDIVGAAVNGREKKDLPPSRLARYASDKRTDTNPVLRTVNITADAGTVLLPGGQSFSITIDKHANDRYYEPKHEGLGGGAMPKEPKVPLSAPSQPAKPAEEP